MDALRQDRTAEQQNSRAADDFPHEVCGCDGVSVGAALIAAVAIGAVLVVHGVGAMRDAHRAPREAPALVAASTSPPQPTRMASLPPAPSQGEGE